MPILRELRKDGTMAPLVVCDFCGEVIRDAAKANTLWNMKKPDGEVGKVGDLLPHYFAHKKGCTDALEAKVGDMLYWEDLEVLPTFLTRNLAIKPAHLEATLRMRAALQS